MHIKPNKRLGQNFLTDKNIQRKIIDCLHLKPSDIVLEIGAGRGELTGLIAQKANKIYALEIDPNLYTVLKNNLQDYSNIEIIKQDILKFNLRKYFSGIKRRINPVRDIANLTDNAIVSNGVKVVGNIPYYISSPIIERLIKFRDKIDVIFITVQKEFAKRMTAVPGSKLYSAFSCFVQYYFEPKIILNIKKTCFFPAPKVDSSLVRLKIRSKPPVELKDEKFFFKIIRTAFNYRRKTLRNSLVSIISKKKLDLFLHKYGIDRNIRPECLSLQDFANLANT
jgi:16S rRNA (adenine1518-N6/adenine1519-N6)-dimethyltransferase